MTTTTKTTALVDEYLRRLKTAAKSLPRQPRDELMSEIREHLAVAVSPDATEAEVRNVLDHLGEPEEIVAAARPDGQAPVRRGAREVFAILLLLTGFPPIFGWFVGLGLLLSSRLWTARQKLLGVLVWPGGLPFFFVGGLLVVRGYGVKSPTGCSVQTETPLFGAVQTTVSTLGPVTRSCTTYSAGGGFRWAVVILGLAFVAPLLVAFYLYRAAGRSVVSA